MCRFQWILAIILNSIINIDKIKEMKRLKIYVLVYKIRIKSKKLKKETMRSDHSQRKWKKENNHYKKNRGKQRKKCSYNTVPNKNYLFRKKYTANFNFENKYIPELMIKQKNPNKNISF